MVNLDEIDPISYIPLK